MRYRIRPAMSFEEFQDMLGQLIDELPEPLLEDLNGGVVAQPVAKHSDEAPGLLTLGQYVRDPYLGRQVLLYYGSFVYLFGSDRRRWVEEMRRTLRHEIRHHVEDRAGVRDLIHEDREFVRRHLEGQAGNDRRGGASRDHRGHR